MLGTKLFRQAETLALYIHCARLLEVDTTALLQAALSAGKLLPLHARYEDCLPVGKGGCTPQGSNKVK